MKDENFESASTKKNNFEVGSRTKKENGNDVVGDEVMRHMKIFNSC